MALVSSGGGLYDIELYDDDWNRQGNGVFSCAEVLGNGLYRLAYITAEDTNYHNWMTTEMRDKAIQYHLCNCPAKECRKMATRKGDNSYLVHVDAHRELTPGDLRFGEVRWARGPMKQALVSWADKLEVDSFPAGHGADAAAAAAALPAFGEPGGRVDDELLDKMVGV